MKRQKFLAAALLMVTILCSSVAIAAQDVAVVNMREVIEESKQMIAMRQDMQEKFGKKHDALVAKGKKLSEKLAKHEKNKPVLSAQNAKKASAALQKEQQDLAQEERLFQQDVYAKQEESMKKLVDMVKTAAATVAKRDGFSLVLQTTDALFVQDKLDITKSVKDLIEKS